MDKDLFVISRDSLKGWIAIMYDKVSTNFEFVNREKKVLDFWNENHIFEKSIDSRKMRRLSLSMTARRRQTASRISATC